MMDNRLERAENIIFDIGNVLLDFCPEKVCMLLPEAIRQDVLHAMFVPVHGKSRWYAFDLGITPNEEIAMEIAQAAGHPDAVEQVLQLLEDFPSTMEEMPLIQEMPRLKALGKKLYALTNYPEPSFTRTLERFSFFQYLDGYVVSSRVKMAKPDLAIFHLIMEKYALQPEKTLFIDDRADNVAAAAACGLMTWQYPFPE